MATTMAPIAPVYHADIFLDQLIYNPGQLINGEVSLRLSRKLCCDTVTAQLYGSARVFFVQQSTSPGALGKSKAYEQEQVLVDQTQQLWVTMNRNVQKEISLDEIARRASSTSIRLPQAQQLRPGIESGTHTFNFSIALPQHGLHTSFDAKGSAGYVRYYILVKAFNNNMIAMRKKLLFAVVCPRVLPSPPLTLEDRKYVQRKNYEKGAYLEVELTLEKKVYVPGEPIKGYICINNRSGKSVKYANLYIAQETTCFSNRPEVHSTSSIFCTAGMGLGDNSTKVRSGDQFGYSIVFNVPALIPDLEVPNCIHVEYRLELSVGYVRNCSKGLPICIKVPIGIGTHLQHVPCPLPNGLDSLPIGAPPPAYDDIASNGENLVPAPGFHDQPPLYAAVISGLSAIEDHDANGYTPMSVFYNFAYNGGDDAVTSGDGNEKKTQ